MVINSRSVGDVVVFDIDGTYTWEARPKPNLQDLIKAKLHTGERKFLFNLEKAEIESDVGIGDIMASYVSVGNLGGAIKFSTCSPKTLSLLRLTMLHKVFDIYPTEEAALASFVEQKDLPEHIKQFIAHTPWTFAKTYAKTWPHEYTVREKVDQSLFAELAAHIDKFGYPSHFYKVTMTYFDYEGYTYWHMDNIINRCVEAETYHRREKDGRLPK